MHHLVQFDHTTTNRFRLVAVCVVGKQLSADVSRDAFREHRCYGVITHELKGHCVGFVCSPLLAEG